MTAQPKLPTFTCEEIAATRRSLNLHALWKALEAAPLPRLAAWVEAAYLANAFHDQDFVVDGVRRRLAHVERGFARRTCGRPGGPGAAAAGR